MVIWEKVRIIDDKGENVEAISPVIISASRSTDIPSCYSDWFAYRFLQKGNLIWVNPFNRSPVHVSFANTRVIVFWTKNPAPMIKYLQEFDKRAVNYYFQYTLNNYDDLGYEPNIPPIEERIKDFIDLSSLIGKKRIIWRYDPILLSSKIDIDSVVERIKRIGDLVHNHTERLVFSFVDLKTYKKLTKPSIKEGLRELDDQEMNHVAQKICDRNKKWGLDVYTCGERISLMDKGIKKGSCVDGDLMKSLFPNDLKLAAFLKNNNKKDSGQREMCGCISSKDIGEYNTCPNLCQYCYANSSRATVIKNVGSHNRNRYGETITGKTNWSEKNDVTNQIKLM